MIKNKIKTYLSSCGKFLLSWFLIQYISIMISASKRLTNQVRDQYHSWGWKEGQKEARKRNWLFWVHRLPSRERVESVLLVCSAEHTRIKIECFQSWIVGSFHLDSMSCHGFLGCALKKGQLQEASIFTLAQKTYTSIGVQVNHWMREESWWEARVHTWEFPEFHSAIPLIPIIVAYNTKYPLESKTETDCCTMQNEHFWNIWEICTTQGQMKATNLCYCGSMQAVSLDLSPWPYVSQIPC